MTLMELFKDHGFTLVMAIIWPIYWYAMKATFAEKKELDVEKRRITTLESKVEQLPSQKDWSALKEHILDIGGDIKGINADMTHLKKNVELLVTTEMRRKGQ